jgi:hypothetical protein
MTKEVPQSTIISRLIRGAWPLPCCGAQGFIEALRGTRFLHVCAVERGATATLYIVGGANAGPACYFAARPCMNSF